MTNKPALRLGVDQSRDSFFMEGRIPETGLAGHISRSWQRCRKMDQRADLPEPMAIAQLRDSRERARVLLDCAQAEIDGLAEHVVGNDCVVILSDAQGVILEERGSLAFLPKARQVALSPGVEWSEADRGTNAIGTALIERHAVLVVGGEHFLPQNGLLGCAAAPIFTGRGTIAGILDISGEAARVNDHALGLVRLAAEHVEHRMILREARGHLLRLHHHRGLLGTAREGLLVVDEGRITAANRMALGLLGRRWEELLDEPIERLVGAGWSGMQRKSGLLALPGGATISACLEPVPTRWRGTALSDERKPSEESSDVVEPLLQKASKVLNAGVAVLIRGETGSGKEVFARRLYNASRRKSGPFIAVNCAALPEALIEAEIFGYEEGAFTGARRRGMPGRIREAEGGVLFLDEIGDMPLHLQSRLLRVLEDRLVRPLGGSRAVAVDFDLVCATHRDLAAMVTAGQFRSDLFYRVNGFEVGLPALRDRADRKALVERIFRTLCNTTGPLDLDDAALERLCSYRWPGNIRELCSVLRTLIALATPGESVGVSRLPAHIGPEQHTVEPGEDAHRDIGAAGAHEPRALADLKRSAIDCALAESCGNVQEAARRLGVHRSTLYWRLAARKPGEAGTPR